MEFSLRYVCAMGDIIQYSVTSTSLREYNI